VTNPRRNLVLTRSRAAARGLNSWGWSRLTPVVRDSAADQPVRRRWGSASRRLDLGAAALVFRSPVTSSGAEGVGLVPVGSREPREPYRPQIRWGGSAGLPRFGKRGCAGGTWRRGRSGSSPSTTGIPSLSPCALSRLEPKLGNYPLKLTE